ncbi:aldo/keto reductase [Pseudoroseomonas cervicalis]|uniref:aldo/keto reductase n=1 Tax=Teichococcus cervicalis TaxID=204525 RepID=UPI0027869DDA|nr:aldo/keto reductase [Pseudoroseomonas cervicalis]MDQ1078706.1 2,5-diketo-D-gluconate reductase B [Pseudoroseomonas cervicalis]
MIPTLKTDRISIPKLGLGTWKLAGAEGQAAVESAIALGYRHIDTADRYGNEEAVGAGLKASGVARGDLFVTSKVWFDNLAPDSIRRSLDGSLRKLGTDHLDLFLVHWPTPQIDLAAVARTMQAVTDEGLTRHWGVSNFPPALMRQLEELGAKPACLQVEYHATLSQQLLLDWCRPRGIALTAYSPLGQGALADEPVLERIGRKHGASAQQVALAWLLRQEGVVAIPKAGRRESQQANLDAVPLAAKLDVEDVAAIDALPKDRRRVNPDFAPAWDSL